MCAWNEDMVKYDEGAYVNFGFYHFMGTKGFIPPEM
jgi:hypothetical protein